ncbi:MAG: hypothetical protein AAF471_02000 [Myxococcota bacterium]
MWWHSLAPRLVFCLVCLEGCGLSCGSKALSRSGGGMEDVSGWEAADFVVQMQEGLFRYEQWRDFSYFSAALRQNRATERDFDNRRQTINSKIELLAPQKARAQARHGQGHNLDARVKSYAYKSDQNAQQLLKRPLPVLDWSRLRVTDAFFAYGAANPGQVHGYFVAGNKVTGGWYTRTGNAREERIVFGEAPAIAELFSRAESSDFLYQTHGWSSSDLGQVHVITAPVLARLDKGSTGRDGYNALKQQGAANPFSRNITWFPQDLRAAFIFTRVTSLQSRAADSYSKQEAQTDFLRAIQAAVAAKQAGITNPRVPGIGAGAFKHPPAAALIRAAAASAVAGYSLDQVMHHGYGGASASTAQIKSQALAFLKQHQGESLGDVAAALRDEFYQ